MKIIKSNSLGFTAVEAVVVMLVITALASIAAYNYGRIQDDDQAANEVTNQTSNTPASDKPTDTTDEEVEKSWYTYQSDGYSFEVPNGWNLTLERDGSSEYIYFHNVSRSEEYLPNDSSVSGSVTETPTAVGAHEGYFEFSLYYYEEAPIDVPTGGDILSPGFTLADYDLQYNYYPWGEEGGALHDAYLYSIQEDVTKNMSQKINIYFSEDDVNGDQLVYTKERQAIARKIVESVKFK